MTFYKDASPSRPCCLWLLCDCQAVSRELLWLLCVCQAVSRELRRVCYPFTSDQNRNQKVTNLLPGNCRLSRLQPSEKWARHWVPRPRPRPPPGPPGRAAPGPPAPQPGCPQPVTCGPSQHSPRTGPAGDTDGEAWEDGPQTRSLEGGLEFPFFLDLGRSRVLSISARMSP